MIVSRVIVGDPWYANKVDSYQRLPPVRKGTKKRHDSVIAKPGPMPGHQQNLQAHQEVVVFGNAQAYPSFIVQYTTE